MWCGKDFTFMIIIISIVVASSSCFCENRLATGVCIATQICEAFIWLPRFNQYFYVCIIIIIISIFLLSILFTGYNLSLNRN